MKTIKPPFIPREIPADVRAIVGEEFIQRLEEACKKLEPWPEEVLLELAKGQEVMGEPPFFLHERVSFSASDAETEPRWYKRSTKELNRGTNHGTVIKINPKTVRVKSDVGIIWIVPRDKVIRTYKV